MLQHVRGPEPIRLNYVTSPQYERMTKDLFLGTFLDRFPLVEHQYSHYTGYFRDGFSQAILFKLDRIIESLELHPRSISVWSDVDIIFFRPVEPYIRGCLSRVDLAISPEHDWGWHINSGFLAARGTKANIEMFREVRRLCYDHGLPGEQGLIDQFLMSGRVPWCIFPKTFRNTTMPNQLPPDSVFFHANNVCEAGVNMGFKVNESLPHRARKEALLRAVRLEFKVGHSLVF